MLVIKHGKGPFLLSRRIKSVQTWRQLNDQMELWSDKSVWTWVLEIRAENLKSLKFFSDFFTKF